MKSTKSILIKKTFVVIMMVLLIVISSIISVSAEDKNNMSVIEIDMGEYLSTMMVGEKQLLEVTVLPIDVTNQVITYSSSNTKVATINGMGRITAISVGTTVITATCQGKSGSFILSVKEKEIDDILVTELDLGEYESKMEIGSTQLLSVTPLPTIASNTTLAYKSSDTSVATINGMGRISALKIGKATITVQCGNIISTINITVVEKKNDVIEVSEIEIANHEDKVKVDEAISLSATVYPADATDSTITYKSSNENVATVNSSGEVKGVSAGTVIITIKAGKIVKKERIEVVVPTKGINMNSNYLVLKPGATFALSGFAIPSDAVQTLKYKSMDSRIAKVSSSGVITAQAVGSTSIIVSNGDYQAAVVVIVNTLNSSLDKNNEKQVINGGKNSTTYDDLVYVSQVKKIDTDRLKHLYINKSKLLVAGEKYTITIDGNSIVNYLNEFNTDIQLSYSTILQNDAKKSIKGLSFVINDEKALCGDIILNFDDVPGKYLYLYNDAKEKYEIIECNNLSQIKISTPGKYVILDAKINDNNKCVIIFIFVCCGILGIGSVIYIILKKKYWFW